MPTSNLPTDIQNLIKKLANNLFSLFEGNSTRETRIKTLEDFGNTIAFLAITKTKEEYDKAIKNYCITQDDIKKAVDEAVTKTKEEMREKLNGHKWSWIKTKDLPLTEEAEKLVITAHNAEIDKALDDLLK